MSAVSKAVIVTGCSSGIGRAIAERLLRGDWPVYATARRLEDIRDLEARGCHTLSCNVCDEASMRAAVDEVESREGAVGVLVNNAGYGQEGALEDVTLEAFRRQFETNVFGLVRLTQLVLPGMRRQGWGKIVNMSSVGGRLTFPGGGPYHASKHAVEALSDALRFEVRSFGVDVILIEPGPIKTRFGETAIGSVQSAARPGDSPYTDFNAQVRDVIREAYEGPMGALAAGPDAVARVVERAISARRPKARYPVTAMARVLLSLRRWLPDRAFDAFLRTHFTPPAPAAHVGTSRGPAVPQ